jgi:hypothetical protein
VGLFKRSDGARVVVTPEVVSPRQTVQVTITTDRPVDTVSSATLEWGYTNFYRYRWAGRADSAAAAGNDSLWMMDQVGTDAGSEKDTEDWVSVTKVELPIATGEFSGGSSSFTVPSWAPGSSEELARWSARLTVQRGGRDIDTRGDFTVVIGRIDLEVTDAPQQRTGGDGQTDIDIVLPSLVYRAGETITGSVTLTPRTDMSDGELGIYWGRSRISHPLVRTPAAGGGGKSGQTIKLGKGIRLRNGTPVTVPFAVPLPEDPADGRGGALIARVVSRGHPDVLEVDPRHREGPPSDRCGQRAVSITPAKRPTPPRPARQWGARRCSARTARRPAARSLRRR